MRGPAHDVRRTPAANGNADAIAAAVQRSRQTATAPTPPAPPLPLAPRPRRHRPPLLPQEAMPQTAVAIATATATAATTAAGTAVAYKGYPPSPCHRSIRHQSTPWSFPSHITAVLGNTAVSWWRKLRRSSCAVLATMWILRAPRTYAGTNGRLAVARLPLSLCWTPLTGWEGGG